MYDKVNEFCGEEFADKFQKLNENLHRAVFENHGGQ